MGPELLLGLKDLFPQKRRDELVEIARFRAGHSRSYPRGGENGSPAINERSIAPNGQRWQTYSASRS